MTGNDQREQRQFHDLLGQVLSGSLDRRQVMLRAAALGLSAASASTLAVAASGNANHLVAKQDAATPTAGGTLRVGLQGDPAEIDPALTQLTAAQHVIEHIYDTLVREKPDLTIEPVLAAEMPTISADGLTYTFTIRQGVMWHPPVSRPLVAGDIKYTYERVVDPATSSPSLSLLASMASVEAPDDATVVITLKSADASFLSALTNRFLSIVAKEFVDQNNGNLNQTACGTGPFIFQEYVPNTSLTVAKNPNYWETGKPYLDGIEFTPISDDTQRTNAILTDTVDLIEYAPLQDIDRLQGESSLQIAGDVNTNIRFIDFNERKKPFDDVRIRQAVALAINRDEILQPATYGHGIATEVIFPQGNWAHIDVPPTQQNVDQAKKLLADAGFPNGLKLEIMSWSSYSFLSQPSYVVQSQLEAVGITSEVVLEENATYIQRYITSPDYDITVTGTSGFVDPNDVFGPSFTTGSSSNASGYSNPQADQLIAQGIATTDQAQRASIYQQLQQLLLQDLPWVNLFIANQYEALKKNVNGYVHYPTGTLVSLRDTWLGSGS